MRTPFELADVVRTFGDQLVEKTTTTPLQRKVLGKIAGCRTALLGGHEEACEHCGTIPTVTTVAATGTVPNARLQSKPFGLTIWCEAPCPSGIITSSLQFRTC